MAQAQAKLERFRVYKLEQGVKSGRCLDSFPDRSAAVYYCKMGQTLPLPNYEWADEFCIVDASDSASQW